MTPQWVVALASAIVGALITFASQSLAGHLNRKRMRMQLLQQLRLEIETAQRVAQRLGTEDSVDTVGLITLPTVTTQFLLTGGLLHPVRDRTLVTALLTYWSLSSDLQHTIFQDASFETFRQWILSVASDIDGSIPNRTKRRKG